MPYLLQQLLELSARHHPDKAAVSDKNGSLNYGELERSSNQIAHVLRSVGVEEGDRVGIYLHKSLKAVVAIFGIMKAGAAYVPLDPDAPAKRVAFMLDNCAMKGLVTTQEKVTKLGAALSGIPSLGCLIVTDKALPVETMPMASQFRCIPWSAALQAPPAPPPAPHLTENDLAYILYTSGSTGTPKGVMISHRAALTFVNWAADYFQLRPKDRLSNHAPFHFDLSIFDIFASIKAGATVVLVPPEFTIFPSNLADSIEEQQITVWYSVPSALTRLVLYGSLERYAFSKLRAILFAGEVFPVKYLRQLKTAIPHADYYNLYGPTETNVCTVYPIKAIPPEQAAPFPIGRACADSEVFAVNEQGQLTKPGEIGELYVSGPSLMGGYWGLPEKTRDVIIPHMLKPSGGVYQTGDLVKQDTEGNYHFVGRRDSMIKSRGYRIELGEIEAVLQNHPDVEEVAVIPIPHEEIGNVLRAVVVSPLSENELIAFCAERLPKYMIPGEFDFRSVLPKTSTGKIDKTALQEDKVHHEDEGRTDNRSA